MCSNGDPVGRLAAVTAWDALRLMCDTTLVPVLAGEAGELLDRAAPDGSRHPPSGSPSNAATAAAPTPAAPSPRTGAVMSAAHHCHNWAASGPTDLANLVLLCPKHHHDLHDRGHHPTRHPTGNLTWHRPDGTPIRAP